MKVYWRYTPSIQSIAMRMLRTSLLLAAIALTCAWSAPALAQNVFTYLESDSVIANPERGLQKYSITNSSYNTLDNYSSLSEATLRGWRTGADKVTVVYRYFLLDAFMSGDISDRYLANIQRDFDIVRNAGMKILVRFSYTNRQGTTPQQPVKSQILRHIQQLAPVLQANADVIVAHQAGFIGTWGEWYYTNSTEFGTDGSISSMQWGNRREVVDAMLAATPVGIPIQVRYASAKQNLYGTQILTEETAYADTPRARVGFYNDAFLNVWGDMGTYRVSGGQNANPVGSADYTYMANETQFLPMSGETNGLNAPRTDGANALLEMDLANWSIVNRDYHSSVINGWITSGHFPEILRKIGYRFVLRRTAFSQDGPDIRAVVDLENIGSARPFLARKAYLVFKRAGDGAETSVEVSSDIRRWAEGENRLTVTIPAETIGNGLHEVFLYLPDPNLPDRPEYAIRFANADVWQYGSGRNKLGQIEITGNTLSTPRETPGEGPRGAVLHPAYPNPFNPSTVIGFTLPEQLAGASVRLSVYDILGREVVVLTDGHLPAGDHSAVFDATALVSGLYIVRLQAGEVSRSIRVTLAK